MKTYDIVKKILLYDERSRNSDKRLMFQVWKSEGIDCNDYDEWMERASHPKSIIESRRNLQRDQEERIEKGEYIPHDELVISADVVYKLRKELSEQKGTHIFREDMPVNYVQDQLI